MRGCDFFISYTRRDDALGPLADTLYNDLTGAGHDVFLDVHIPPGGRWGSEIENALASCKVFVVLLSEISVTREMVIEEIRRIKVRQEDEQESTPPVILPVRVNYTAALPYQLGAYLNPIQGLRWTSDADTPTLLDALTNTLKNPPPPPDLHVPAPAAPTAPTVRGGSIRVGKINARNVVSGVHIHGPESLATDLPGLPTVEGGTIDVDEINAKNVVSGVLRETTDPET